MAFLAQARTAGLVPTTFAFPYGDLDVVYDAHNVCDILVYGYSESSRTDLQTERDSRINRYGITAAQAKELMVLSAQTYCPRRVAVVSQVLG